MSTKLQVKVYQFITELLAKRDYSPSLEEIAWDVGSRPRSVSRVNRCVPASVKKDKFIFYKKGRRNIKAPFSPSFTSSLLLPVLGKIAAGSPIEAIADYRAIDIGYILQGESHFVLEVKGDSMVEEGILNEDLVICKQADTAKEGEIVVALIDQSDTTLKRISYQIKGRVTLIPKNPHLKPKAYLPHRVQIQGVFVGLLRLNSKAPYVEYSH